MSKRLELFYPMKPYILYQPFGTSLSCTEDTPDISITKRKVATKVNGVCPAGYVELYPLLGMKGHTGLDLGLYHGQNIYAAQEGIVTEIQTESERGLGISIITQEKYSLDDAGEHYIKHRYWHLMSFNVKLGDVVEAGDYIGQGDNTGLSSGDHCHFEIKPVEPSPNFIDPDTGLPGNYYNVFQTNGYFGAIDPAPFFNKYFAQDAKIIVGIMRSLITTLTALVNLLKK